MSGKLCVRTFDKDTKEDILRYMKCLAKVNPRLRRKRLRWKHFKQGIAQGKPAAIKILDIATLGPDIAIE